MAKKSKKTSAEAPKKVVVIRSFPLPVPVSSTRDELALMPDESLTERFNAMVREREQVVATSPLPPIPWEQEICYVQREQGTRIARRTAHEKYMRTFPIV